MSRGNPLGRNGRESNSEWPCWSKSDFLFAFVLNVAISWRVAGGRMKHVMPFRKTLYEKRDIYIYICSYTCYTVIPWYQSIEDLSRNTSKKWRFQKPGWLGGTKTNSPDGFFHLLLAVQVRRRPGWQSICGTIWNGFRMWWWKGRVWCRMLGCCIKIHTVNGWNPRPFGTHSFSWIQKTPSIFGRTDMIFPKFSTFEVIVWIISPSLRRTKKGFLQRIYFERPTTKVDQQPQPQAAAAAILNFESGSGPREETMGWCQKVCPCLCWKIAGPESLVVAYFPPLFYWGESHEPADIREIVWWQILLKTSIHLTSQFLQLQSCQNATFNITRFITRFPHVGRLFPAKRSHFVDILPYLFPVVKATKHTYHKHKHHSWFGIGALPMKKPVYHGFFWLYFCACGISEVFSHKKKHPPKNCNSQVPGQGFQKA